VPYGARIIVENSFIYQIHITYYFTISNMLIIEVPDYRIEGLNEDVGRNYIHQSASVDHPTSFHI
jgi:hypothetical protein